MYSFFARIVKLHTNKKKKPDCPGYMKLTACGGTATSETQPQQNMAIVGEFANLMVIMRYPLFWLAKIDCIGNLFYSWWNWTTQICFIGPFHNNDSWTLYIVYYQLNIVACIMTKTDVSLKSATMKKCNRVGGNRMLLYGTGIRCTQR